MEKVGIFGGTYNPPHVGHLNIVKIFAKKYELDKMLIIPTYIPPHKDPSVLASCEDRLEMCRLTFKGEPFETSSIEIDRKGRSYTDDTLKMLKGMYKKAQFFLLVGDDMLTTLHEWKRPDDILDMCTIVASVRSDKMNVSQLEEYSKAYFPNEYREGKIQFLDITPLELSSTEIRNRIKCNESIDGLVTKETYEYIFSRGLYGAGTQR